MLARRLIWICFLLHASLSVHAQGTPVPIEFRDGVLQYAKDAIERCFGGAEVSKLAGDDCLRNVGIEDLRLVSDFDPANPRDEEHGRMAVEAGPTVIWARATNPLPTDR